MAYLYRVIASTIVRKLTLIVFAAVVGVVSMLWHKSAEAAFAAKSACSSGPCDFYRIGGAPKASSVAGACGAWMGYYVAQPGASFYPVQTGGSASTCIFEMRDRATGDAVATNQVQTPGHYTLTPDILTCDGGGVLNGAVCQCVYPLIQMNNACEADPNGDAKALAKALNALGAPLCYSGPPGLKVCMGGFVIKAQFGGSNGVGAGGAQESCIYSGAPGGITGGGYSASGETCTGADATMGGTKSDCKTGEVQGQVNGLTVCAPAATTNAVGPVVAASGASAGAGAPAGTTASTQQTTCVVDGLLCKTTTTYKDAAGVTIGTKDTETPKFTYCQANPGSPLCLPKDTASTGEGEGTNFCTENPTATICVNSTWAGDCAGGFTFQGDAIQGAIAKEVYKSNCEFNKVTDESTKYAAAAAAASAAGGSGSAVNTLPGNTSTYISSASFDQTDLIGGAAGLSDLSINVMGNPFTVSFAVVNDWLGKLGALLMAVTFLLCIRIVARG